MNRFIAVIAVIAMSYTYATAQTRVAQQMDEINSLIIQEEGVTIGDNGFRTPYDNTLPTATITAKPPRTDTLDLSPNSIPYDVVFTVNGKDVRTMPAIPKEEIAAIDSAAEAYKNTRVKRNANAPKLRHSLASLHTIYPRSKHLALKIARNNASLEEIAMKITNEEMAAAKAAEKKQSIKSVAEGY